jgi:hypothetical protein
MVPPAVVDEESNRLQDYGLYDELTVKKPPPQQPWYSKRTTWVSFSLFVLFMIGVSIGIVVTGVLIDSKQQSLQASHVHKQNIFLTTSDTTTVLTDNSFEDGSFQLFSGSNGDTRINNRSDRVCDGRYSVRIKKRSSLFHTNSVITTATTYDDYSLSFSYLPKSTKGSDAFIVQYSSNGGSSWKTIKRFQMNVEHPGGNFDETCHNVLPFSLSQIKPTTDTTDLSTITSLKLRFVDDSSSRGAEFYMDDIVLEGVTYENTSPTSPPTSVPSSEPSPLPSSQPSTVPTSQPTSQPTLSSQPSRSPSSTPSSTPSFTPSAFPSTVTFSPTIYRSICPLNRTFPSTKYLIEPYPDTSGIKYVEDDLSEISSFSIASHKDDDNNIYAYVVSDKNQFSLKVIKFTTTDPTKVIVGSATVVAIYNLTNVDFTNADWEDMSTGPCDSTTESKTCIYIGNFGNNNRDQNNLTKPFAYTQRTKLSIFKFEEPLFGGTKSTPVDQDITATIITYDYSSFTNNFVDAEAMFVDWTGTATDGSGKSDIYVVLKGGCSRGVGRIEASLHENLLTGETIDIGSIEKVLQHPPSQGTVTCATGPFRQWQGADMNKDGSLIALSTGISPPRVYFYTRGPDQNVTDALLSGPCDFVSSTSFGLLNEKQHEAVAFVDDAGTIFAETSECQGGSNCRVPVYFHTLDFGLQSSRTASLTAGGWTTITYDDFESGFGNYMTAPNIPEDPDAVIETTFPCSNSAAVRLRWDNAASSSIFHRTNQDCTSYSWLKVTFQFQLDPNSKYDHLDSLFLELSLDGGNDYYVVGVWAKDVDTIVDFEVCYRRTVELKAEDFAGRTNFGGSVRLRFRANANGKGDLVHVDDILFEGHAG